ncbi:EamA family transporter [Glycomyces sp. TRM65418]|uniref:DMT family transporter n=1 Tax=Glycomyces sp. TRM65418 TaxID=2867006 RepID=UPI001CE553AF|nr:EamA family transporter [Glycomyces sp. TRM65418]MCC3763300.1 EamA family transporter [Glycomyces sp. TRM65418]QZD57299.1 EamA family transporter [Glycomyces sp. TRM65418]
MSTSTLTPARPAEAAARRGLGFLTVTGLAWGTTGAAAEIIYRAGDMGPMAVSFWRHLGGLALLLAFTAIRPRPRRTTGVPLRRRAALLTGVGIGMAVFQTAYFAAVDATGVAAATLLTLGSGPILTAIGGRLLIGERLGRGGVIAVAGALAGLGVLVGGNADGVVAPLGAVYALLSAAGYAAVTLLGRATGRRRDGEDPFTLTMWSFGIGAAVLLAPAWAEGLLPGEGAAVSFAAVGYLAVFTTALAYPLYFAGAARVRATTASVMMLLEPVTAAFLAVAFLGEPFTIATAAGSVVLLGSIAALAAAESRR